MARHLSQDPVPDPLRDRLQSRLLAALGRLSEAREPASQAWSISPAVRAAAPRVGLELPAGDTAAARRVAEQAMRDLPTDQVLGDLGSHALAWVLSPGDVRRLLALGPEALPDGASGRALVRARHYDRLGHSARPRPRSPPVSTTQRWGGSGRCWRFRRSTRLPTCGWIRRGRRCGGTRGSRRCSLRGGRRRRRRGKGAIVPQLAATAACSTTLHYTLAPSAGQTTSHSTRSQPDCLRLRRRSRSAAARSHGDAARDIRCDVHRPVPLEGRRARKNAMTIPSTNEPSIKSVSSRRFKSSGSPSKVL